MAVKPISVAISISYVTPAPEAAFHVKLVGTGIAVDPFNGDNNVTALVGSVTVSVKFCCLIPEVLLADNTSVYVPAVTEPMFEIVKVLDPTGVTGLVLKLANPPAGTPVKVNVTGSEYPPIDPISMRYDALVGEQTLTLVGVTVIV